MSDRKPFRNHKGELTWWNGEKYLTAEEVKAIPYDDPRRPTSAHTGGKLTDAMIDAGAGAVEEAGDDNV